MEFFFVELVLEKSKNQDQSYFFRLKARNDNHALFLAKKLLKSECPNLSKIWCWFVEGRPNRK